MAGSPKLFGRPAPSPSLRRLAGGRPLIGAAVPTWFRKALEPADLEILATHFDSVTAENCMKWQSLSPQPDLDRFKPGDALVKLAEKNGQKVVGHTLVFNRKGNYPDWILRDGTKEADAKLLWKRLEDHVVKLMTRYQGRIDSWDVLNEFVEVHDPGYRQTDLTRILGPDYPTRLFKLAAEVDPKAKLTYNDFSVEQPQRKAAILKFIRSLQDQGCRIDVVGSQSHLEINAKGIGESVEHMIEDFAKLGVRCALTELDVDVIPRKGYWNPKTRAEATIDPYTDGCPPEIQQQQADIYGEVFEAVMNQRKHVDRVTLWGITDRRSWLNTWPWKRTNHGLLFDRQSQPKPAFDAVAKVLAKNAR